MDPYTDPLYGSYMDPDMDPIWTPIWIPLWTIWILYDPFMDHIWIRIKCTHHAGKDQIHGPFLVEEKIPLSNVHSFKWLKVHFWILEKLCLFAITITIAICYYIVIGRIIFFVQRLVTFSQVYLKKFGQYIYRTLWTEIYLVNIPNFCLFLCFYGLKYFIHILYMRTGG